MMRAKRRTLLTATTIAVAALLASSASADVVVCASYFKGVKKKSFCEEESTCDGLLAIRNNGFYTIKKTKIIRKDCGEEVEKVFESNLEGGGKHTLLVSLRPGCTYEVRATKALCTKNKITATVTVESSSRGAYIDFQGSCTNNDKETDKLDPSC